MTAPIIYQESRHIRYFRGVPADGEEFASIPMHARGITDSKTVYGNLPGQLWERIAEGVTR
ncbi:hypothetical protein [Rathayibacter sp. VKM Ac-2630]|uniref:hypothetical protein n=1 Tax=Rathayibacter sp. VKM Ac-2630 TaxID=1938617 RepID=UPI001115ACB5|nr:hypothetical protein [Rathayibacter sp. VKM Ac-2630]